jgi:SAM-dependent methyltransferase
VDACGCDGLATTFDRRVAERDRDRYRRHGPDRTTRLLLDLIRPYGVGGASVLDIGGGIGVIDCELLAAGAGHALLVDASPAYLDVARQEARQANLLARLEFVDGDFVRRAGDIDPADIVTLDRVLCCYPDAAALVGLSATRARRVYGLVLPRDRWLVRAALRLASLWFRFRGQGLYAHSNATIDALVAATGLQPRSERVTLFWRVVVYDRAAAA